VGADATGHGDSGADGSTDAHTGADAADAAATADGPGEDTGDACAPFMCDPANCGVAGHDCLGGSCVAGTCQPVALGSFTGAKYLALSQDSVYVTEQGSAMDMKAVSKDGGTPVTIVPSGTFTGYPLDLFVGSQRVYWANDVLTNVYSVDLDGGGPATAFSGTATIPRRLASDGVDLYWTVATGGAAGLEPGVQRGVLPAGSPSTYGEDIQSDGDDLAVNGDGVFWLAASASASYVAFVPRTCAVTPCVGQVLYTQSNNNAALQAIAADDSGVYFGDNAQGLLLGLATDGGTTALALTSMDPVESLALDTTTLYWVDGQAGGTVKSVMRSGHGLTTLAKQRQSPHSVAVDAKAIYWLEGPASGAVELFKLAK
jgi:hypothetical protein